MRRLMLSLTFAALAAVAVLAMRPAGALAHPLGNFTVNHYTRIDVTQDGIEVYRVLDMAEIPAFQQRQRIDADGDGDVSPSEAASYADATARELASALSLTVHGGDVSLELASSRVTFPEGQGGLSLLRLTATYRAPLPEGWRDGATDVRFEDNADADRIGWREIVVRAGEGVAIANSDAPSASISAELTRYPEGGLSSPLDVRTASFAFEPGAGAALASSDAHTEVAVRGNPDGALAGFSDLIARERLSAGFIAIAILTAMAFGAIHALSPGHGKTVVAAYLVGSRGTARHAPLLGLVVTATHTSTVYLLGFITLYLSEYIVPERLYPWLGIASGGLIVAMGLSLFVARLRASGALPAMASRVRGWFAPRPQRALAYASADAIVTEQSAYDHHVAHTRGTAHEHEHSHDDHPHGHHDDAQASDAHDASEHRHGFGPAHSHRIPGQDGERVTVRQLVGLGVFGGMLPCPSAIVVMLSAIALHRVAFGLVLIVAFSVGLAGVLTAIGFALVYSRALTARVPALGRIADRASAGGMGALAVRAFPIASAAAVIAAGAVITLRALALQGTI